MVMKGKFMKNILHILSVLIIILTIVISSLGLFYSFNGEPYFFINQYGDSIRIYGDGIYKNDSYFSAPIFRGTDFTLLFIGIPLLIIALIWDLKKENIKTKLFLTSIISIFTYYSTSIAFGVTYNILHLPYIALFGFSFFGLIIGIMEIKKIGEIKTSGNIGKRGIYVFLVLVGIILFVAWLPDIVISMINKRSLELIEIYTTQITYVLDLGILSPVCFICLYLIKKNRDLGLILLGIMLTLCAYVGIMVPAQTIFQYMAGIEITVGVFITKVGTFIALSIFALYNDIKLFKNITAVPKI